MKAKLGIIFLLVGALICLTIFKFDRISIFLKKQQGAEQVVENVVSFDGFNNFLTSNKSLDYTTKQFNMPDLSIQSKTIYVHLWASWCAPCLNEIPELINFAKVNRDSSLFILVSLDDSKDDLIKFLKSFPEMEDPAFIRIWDQDKKLSKFFDADRLPMTVVFNSKDRKVKIVRSVIDWKTIN
ncbi:MAG: TlpA disulfide reductase family protein [Pseudobdellovibrio sp.]